MKRVAAKLLLLLSIGLCLFSGISLYRIFSEYQQAEEEYSYLSALAVTETTPKANAPEYADSGAIEEPANAPEAEWEREAPITVDFAALKAINPEVIGWIYIGSLDISYPVVQGEDNAYYLHHSVEGKENSSGAIFLDCANAGDFGDPNSIIYGHNMKSGKMFGTLRQLLTQETYEADPDIWVLTPQRVLRYRIFSAYTTEETSDTYTLFAKAGKEFQAYQQKMKARAEYETGIDPEGTMLTLSTCSYSARFWTVVQAVIWN